MLDTRKFASITTLYLRKVAARHSNALRKLQTYGVKPRICIHHMPEQATTGHVHRIAEQATCAHVAYMVKHYTTKLGKLFQSLQARATAGLFGRLFTSVS